jgi:hypothetical protein
VAAARGLERADRMLMHFIIKMGAEPALHVIASTTRFEDMHVLTREETVRFGIDRREFMETPWTFENNGRSMVRKTVAQKNDADKSFLMSQWRLYCSNTEQFELALSAPGCGQLVFFHGFDLRRWPEAALPFARVIEAGAIRSLGPAHDKGIGSIADRIAAAGFPRNVTSHGWAPARTLREVLQRGDGERAG